jgi:chemotaxis protein methyltransferase CheR
MCESDVSLRARAPIILCRNVFIYFSLDAIERVVRSFASAMPAPAYLCVGAAESLLRVDSPFVLEEIDGAFVYVKRTENE